jgi:hypothetical protein
MTHAARYLATGSILALMTAFSFTASAQDRNRMNGSDNSRPTMQDNCVGVECMPDRGQAPERTQRPDNSNAGKNMKGEDDKRREVNRDRDGGDNNRVDRKREARKDWKYDSNRHKRSRNKDSRYRYYYGGYWYLEPYWTGPVFSRVSCGEGRAIVNDSGFNRVRTIECSGRNYTYAARRHGDTFRVALNSRTGEIVSVRPM